MTMQSSVVSSLRSQRVAGVGALSVALSQGRTRLARLREEGAAKIRLPKGRREGLEAVLINTAGGLTGGDRLRWDIQAEAGSTLTITTQACERAYRSADGHAAVTASISVAEGASLAWLPQETILYDRSALRRSVDISVAPGARALIVEPVILGRKAHGETVELAEFRDRWRVRDCERLIHAEEFALGPHVAGQMARSVFGNGARAFATILLVGDDAELLLQPLRDIIGAHGGASFWQVGRTGKLLARLIAEDGYALRSRLVPALQLLNGQAPLPKLWSL
jgi:urease accessory protein